VTTRHDACGSKTRVRVPVAVPAAAVRRLRCASCEATYETEDAVEVGLEPAAEVAPGRAPAEARGWRGWSWLSVPVGAAAVIGAMILIQGGDADPGTATPLAPATATPGSPLGPESGDGAELIRERHFALALPEGWRRQDAQGGAALVAVAPGDEADATLWIERAPGLGIAQFEERSLDQLRSLAGSARVVDRVEAPRPDATIVRLAAVAPPDEPRLEVTLRAAGPFRYYLATTVQPGAARAATDGAELIHGSFVPESAGDR